MMIFFDTGLFKHKFFFLTISLAICLTDSLPCAAMEGKQDDPGVGAKISRFLKKSNNFKYTFSNPTEIEVSNNNNDPEPNKGNLSSTQKKELSNNNNELDLKSKSKQKSKSKKQTSKRSEEKELPNQSDPKEARLSSPADLNLCFDEVPNEILYSVFNWLSERERINLGLCSKRMNDFYYDYEKRLLESPQAAENIFLPPDIPHQLKSSNKNIDIKKFVLFHKRYQQALLKMLQHDKPWKEYSSWYSESRKSARKVSAPLEEIAPKSITVALLRYLTKVKNLKNVQENHDYRNDFINILRKTYFNKKNNSWEIKNDKDLPLLQEILGLSTYFGLSLKEAFPQVSLPVSSIAGRLLGSMQLRLELERVKGLPNRAQEAAIKYNQLLSYNLFITIEDLWNAINANIANKDEDPAFELIEDILRKNSSTENIRRALAAINTPKSQTSRKNINLKAKLYEQLLKGEGWGKVDIENAILFYEELVDKEEDKEKKDIKNRILELCDLLYTKDFDYLVSNQRLRKIAIKANMESGNYKWVAQLWEQVLTKLQTGNVQKGEINHYRFGTNKFPDIDKEYFTKDEVIGHLIEIYEIYGPLTRLVQLWDEIFNDCHGNYYGNIPSIEIRAAKAHAKLEHVERSLELYKKALKRTENLRERIKIRKAIIKIYLKLDKKEKVPALCDKIFALASSLPEDKGIVGYQYTGEVIFGNEEEVIPNAEGEIILNPGENLRRNNEGKFFRRVAPIYCQEPIYGTNLYQLKIMKDIASIYLRIEDKSRFLQTLYKIFESPFKGSIPYLVGIDMYVMQNLYENGMKEEAFNIVNKILNKKEYSNNHKFEFVDYLKNNVFEDSTSTDADRKTVNELEEKLQDQQ